MQKIACDNTMARVKNYLVPSVRLVLIVGRSDAKTNRFKIARELRLVSKASSKTA